jgi:hypothetical protein
VEGKSITWKNGTYPEILSLSLLICALKAEAKKSTGYKDEEAG